MDLEGSIKGQKYLQGFPNDFSGRMTEQQQYKSTQQKLSYTCTVCIKNHTGCWIQRDVLKPFDAIAILGLLGGILADDKLLQLLYGLML